MKKPIVVIAGPTASGKSALAISLAKLLGGEVVSADSMQIYKGMDIGTAKPTLEEMQGIPHHMIDVIEPSVNFSVGDYAELAGRAIDGVLSRGKLPILAGGTGLYIDTLIEGTRLSSAGCDNELRAKLLAQANEVGGAEMKKILAQFDAESAAKLHDNDIKRIVRAIEVYRLTGKTKPEWDRESKAESQYNPIYFALNAQNRDFLYNRIDARVDFMFEQGLYDEVKALLDSGIDEGTTAMQAIGYKETALAVRGEITPLCAAELIKSATRHYAKRQLTWFRRNQSYNWFNIDCESAENISTKAHNLTKSFFSL